MPGMVGIVKQIERDRLDDELDRMLRRVLREGAFQVDRYRGTLAGLASVRLDSEQTISVSPGLAVAAAGEIVQPEVLKHRLGLYRVNIRHIKTTSDLLLELYKAFGIEGLAGLNGAFSAAIWEENPRRLTLVRDRLGTIDLYYWRTPKMLLFANEMKAISWHPAFDRKLDGAAVADLFLHKTLQGERNLFADIRSVPPAGYVVDQDGELRTETYWAPKFFTRGTPLKSPAEYVDEFDHHLREAVRRRLHPESALLVTGGLDSRALAAVYRQIAPEASLRLVSVGTPSCRDVTLGKEIARRLEYAHDRLPLDGAYFADYAEASCWRAEGKVLAHESWIYALEPYLRRNGFRYAMTGLFGNFISGRHYPAALLRAKSIDQAVEAVRMESAHHALALSSVMRQDIYRQVIEESLGWEEEMLRCAEGPDLLNRFDQLALRSSVPRTGQNLAIFGDAARSIDPFTDIDLVDFALSMPPRMRAGGNLYKQMIVDRLPRVRRIPYSRTGHTLVLDLLISQVPWIEQLDDYRRQAVKKLWPGKYGKTAVACFAHAELTSGKTREYILQVLARKEYLEDYFDVDAVEKMLHDHLARKVNAYKTISALVTFSLWRQQFCAEGVDVLWSVPAQVDLTPANPE